MHLCVFGFRIVMRQVVRTRLAQFMVWWAFVGCKQLLYNVNLNAEQTSTLAHENHVVFSWWFLLMFVSISNHCQGVLLTRF